MGWSVSSRFRPNAAVNPLFRSKAEGGGGDKQCAEKVRTYTGQVNKIIKGNNKQENVLAIFHLQCCSLLIRVSSRSPYQCFESDTDATGTLASVGDHYGFDLFNRIMDSKITIQMV